MSDSIPQRIIESISPKDPEFLNIFDSSAFEDNTDISDIKISINDINDLNKKIKYYPYPEIKCILDLRKTKYFLHYSYFQLLYG